MVPSSEATAILLAGTSTAIRLVLSDVLAALVTFSMIIHSKTRVKLPPSEKAKNDICHKNTGLSIIVSDRPFPWIMNPLRSYSQLRLQG
jgi:hypothetical protein